MFFRLLKAELLKLKRSQIITILLLAPSITGGVVARYNGGVGDNMGQVEWPAIFQLQIIMHGQLLFPLLTALTVAYLCRHEHLQSNWKQYLTQPVTRWQVYLAKITMSFLAVLIIQVLMMAALYTAGMFRGFESSFPFQLVFTSYGNGLLATLPLITLQLWISTWWKSFAGALVVNVIFTLPAVLIAQSAQYGPWYPWAQPLLAMLPNETQQAWMGVSVETLIFIIGGSTLVFLIAGFTTFRKRAY